MRLPIKFVAALSVLGMVAAGAQPVVLINDGLSAVGPWTVLSSGDSAATFGYDYSADGIPAAPNGADTIGLKMEANLTGGVARQISASQDLAAAGYVSGLAYSVEVDLWGNFALAGTGTTEFLGAGVGHDGVTAGLNGASLVYTGDGGSSRDYRMYKNSGEQFIASGQYTTPTNNGFDPVYQAAFPAIDVAVAAPGQGQVGLTDNGDGGFQWMRLLIEVDPLALGVGVTADLGLASFTLTSATSGNSVLVGTLDNSNSGTVVNMEGGVSLIYRDLFSSLANTPGFQFGIYDNLLVTMVPEPSSMMLCLLGVGMLRRTRRS